MVGIGKRIPVQLFEAIFLFLLCGWLVIRYCEGRRCGMPLYMMLYGTWRFFAEYLRDDYRGNSLVSFLTPSQLISLVLAVAGLILLIVEATAERAARLRAERGEAFRAELLAARATAMPDAGAEEQAKQSRRQLRSRLWSRRWTARRLLSRRLPHRPGKPPLYLPSRKVRRPRLRSA